jgi:hypothetical protein
MLRRRKPLLYSSTLSIPLGDSKTVAAPLTVRKREGHRGKTSVYQILGFIAFSIILLAVSKRSQHHERFPDIPGDGENKIFITSESSKGETYTKRRHRLGGTSSIHSDVAVNSSYSYHSKGRKETVICSDGSSGFLNDDYCDCLDGSDEPRTSACSHLRVQSSNFDCGDGILFIFASRVHDGIIDCPNGSDERT